jgi:hypothetical protein
MKRKPEDKRMEVPTRHRSDSNDDHDLNRYLDLPLEEKVKAYYWQFYEATLNRNLQHVICAVCARDVRQLEEKVQVIGLKELPNRDYLKP